MPNKIPPEKRFYKAAFSYASENREYVTEVYECLVSLVEENDLCRKEEIFFDIPDFQQGLVNGAKPLKKIYAEQTEFIVPFHCHNYSGKKWTKIEHREIIYLLDNNEEVCIIPVRFDTTEIEDFKKFTTVYIDAENYNSVTTDSKESIPPDEVANNIFDRLSISTPRGAQLLRRKKWEGIGVNYLAIQKLFKSFDDSLIDNNKELPLKERTLIRVLITQVIAQQYLDHFPTLNDITYLTTIDWLSEIEGYESLPRFVDLFITEKRQDINEDTFSKIEDWLEDCCTLRLKIKREYLNPQTEEKEADSKLYSLIELIETDEEHSYRVMISLTNNGNSERQITPEALEQVNIRDEKSKQEFTEQLFEYLAELQLTEETNNIELEFIVPFNLLWCDFEQWKNEDGDSLGAYYPLSLRPEETIRNEKSRYMARWKSINTTDLLNEQIQFLDKAIKPELKKHQPKLKMFATNIPTNKYTAIAIEQPLKPSCSSIKLLIHNGSPIILWAKKGAAKPISKNFLDIYGVLQQQIEQLPTAIRKIREQGISKKPKDLENNIVLLFDDKERLPPPQGQLQSPYREE